MPAPADLPPAASPLAEDIHCPLCDYNLRGLSDPRCPECGYTFTWPALRRQFRHQNTFAFDATARPGLRSLLKTMLLALFPQTFWQRLQPAHRPRAARLLTYCAVIWLPLLLVLLLDPYLREQYSRYRSECQRVETARASFAANVKSDPEVLRRVLSAYGTVEAYAQKMVPSSWVSAWTCLSSPLTYLGLRLLCLLLPALTWPVLLIYQASMRKRHIRQVHVLRAFAYASTFILPGTLIAFGIIPAIDHARSRWVVLFHPSYIDRVVAGCALVSIVLMTYPLWMAYRHYFRFPHALAVALCSQLIVFLLWLEFMALVNSSWLRW